MKPMNLRLHARQLMFVHAATRPKKDKLVHMVVESALADLTDPWRCYGNASTRKRLNAEMPQKPLLRNFRFILGNPSKLEKGEGFPNIFKSFPNI